VTAIAGNAGVASLLRLARSPAAWITTADVAAILLALSLPWSTTLVAVFAVVMLIAMVPIANAGALARSLKRPIAAIPIALFVLAAIGTLRSPAPWSERLYAVGPTA